MLSNPSNILDISTIVLIATFIYQIRFYEEVRTGTLNLKIEVCTFNLRIHSSKVAVASARKTVMVIILAKEPVPATI